MNVDLVRVSPLPDFVLNVELADGRRGVFDMKPHLRLPGLKALRDPSYFAQVQVLLGAATWPDGEDVSPSTLAAELAAYQTA